MVYNEKSMLHRMEKQLNEHSTQIEKLTLQVVNHNDELSSMREECRSALTELDNTNSTLNDVNTVLLALSKKL